MWKKAFLLLNSFSFVVFSFVSVCLLSYLFCGAVAVFLLGERANVLHVTAEEFLCLGFRGAGRRGLLSEFNDTNN